MALLYLTAVAVLVVVLVADPFDGDEPSAREQITTVIERAAVSSDPAYCSDSVTQDYLEQRSGFRGAAALNDCRRVAVDSAATPRAVRVETLDLDGDTAVAEVRHGGGPYSGALLRLELVEEDGWRVNRLVAIEDFDGDLYRKWSHAALVAEPYSYDRATADCVIERLLGMPDDELAASLVDFDPLAAARASVSCDRSAVERLILTSLASAQSGLSPQQFDCVRAAVTGLSDRELIRFYGDPRVQEDLLAACEQGA